MQRRTTGLVALVGVAAFSTCVLRRDALATLEHDLHASIRVVHPGPVPVGSAVEVEFILQNDGASIIQSCFGEAFEVTFSNEREQKSLAELVSREPSDRR